MHQTRNQQAEAAQPGQEPALFTRCGQDEIDGADEPFKGQQADQGGIFPPVDRVGWHGPAPARQQTGKQGGQI